MIVQAEQQLNQLAGTHHLRNQIEGHNHQRTAGREHTDGALFQTIGGDVCKGIAPEVTQALGNQEQNDRPADEEPEGVNEAIIAGGIHQRGDPEEGGGGHKVTRNRQPVLEAGNVSARRVVIVTGAHAFRCPVRDVQRQHDENQEHDDRLPVGWLTLNLAGNGICRMGSKGKCGGKRRQNSLHDAFTSCRTALLRRSNSPFARQT